MLCHTTPKQYTFQGIHDSPSTDTHTYTTISIVNRIHVRETL
jgi:hypothetical protein